MYTPTRVKEIASGKLLCSTESRELSSMLCDDPEEWKEGQEGGSGGRGYIYIVVTDAHCCTVQTDTTLCQ